MKKLSAISRQLEGTSLQDFSELKVWQKAHELTLSVYKITAFFPRDEMYGLTSQLRRSCSSIAANLAAGCGRNGDAEFARYCSIANGISQRDRISPLVSQRPEEDPSKRIIELKRMLTGLRQRLIADS